MRYRAAAGAQHGKGLLGALVVLALAAAGGYYVYQGVSKQDERASCASLLEGCVEHCRRTTTDNDAEEACQQKCQDNDKSCEAKS
ncbi:MAG TPA: hypothetical protein VLX30_00250 [Burkholderiales bacterium]|nr:hypothetical protein [Burkholderiales bacterium]